EKAAAEARKAIDLDPDFAFGYFNVTVNSVYLGRLGEAENALRRAAERGLEMDEFIMLKYDIAFLRSDQAGMEQAAARARERSGGENWISNKEAFALAYSGHLQQARNMTRRAVDQAQHAAQRERAGLWEAGAAVRKAFFGNASEARKGQWPHLSFQRIARWSTALPLRWHSLGIPPTRKRLPMTSRIGFLRIRQSDSAICLSYQTDIVVADLECTFQLGREQALKSRFCSLDGDTLQAFLVIGFV